MGCPGRALVLHTAWAHGPCQLRGFFSSRRFLLQLRRRHQPDGHPLSNSFMRASSSFVLQVWKTNFDAKQGSQRPRSAPSPSRAVADSSLSSRSSSRGGAPTRVSNSPGAHVGRCTPHRVHVLKENGSSRHLQQLVISRC